MDIIEKLSERLDINDIDWRVATIKEKGCQLLAYKDARVDMKRLDTVCGALWQSQYKRDSKGILQCGIGIYIADLKDWVWRWSNGTESFAEAQKGEYSDAFKRAGFMWGIGRELYDVPFTWVTFEDGEVYQQNGKWKTDYKFNPNEWTWEIDFEKQKVSAVDKKGNFRVGFKSNNKEKSKPLQKPPKKEVPNPTPQKAKEQKNASRIDRTLNAITHKGLTPDQKLLLADVILWLPTEEMKPWMGIINNWGKDGIAEMIAEVNGLKQMQASERRNKLNELQSNQIPF